MLMNKWMEQKRWRVLQLRYSLQQQDNQELAAGQPEGRRARVHHVPASNHELPGNQTRDARRDSRGSARGARRCRPDRILSSRSTASTWWCLTRTPSTRSRSASTTRTHGEQPGSAHTRRFGGAAFDQTMEGVRLEAGGGGGGVRVIYLLLSSFPLKSRIRGGRTQVWVFTGGGSAVNRPPDDHFMIKAGWERGLEQVARRPAGTQTRWQITDFNEISSEMFTSLQKIARFVPETTNRM